MRPQPLTDVELVAEGVRLRNSPLYFDARRPTSLSFISHAHGDHLARHKQVIATAETLRLATHRIGEFPSTLPAPYRHPFQLGELTIELLPAGHVLGSAQIRVTRKGRRLVYTGDLNPTPGLTAPAAEVAFCDVLMVESTFGLPKYCFPPREETFGAMARFARASLEEGRTPVFFAYSLGKSQEAIRALTRDGFRVAAHPAIGDICEVYGEFGCPLPHRRFDGTVAEGEVLLYPTGSAVPLAAERMRTAVLSGWALEPGAKYRYGTDDAFPLSDHADFPSLLRYVAETGARRVITLHGFARELAACLRDRGIDAQPLETPRQLELL